MERIDTITFLADAAIRFLELPLEKNIYLFIGRIVKKLVPNSFVFINSFDSIQGILRTEVALGLGKMYDKTAKILGTNPVGMTFPISKEALYALKSNEIQKVPGGLHTLSFGKIPAHICVTLEKLLRIKDIYSIGFVWQRRLYGNATMIMYGTDSIIPYPNVVKAFVKQASIALQHRHAMQKLHYQADLLQNVSNAIISTDLELNIHTWNKAAEDIYGWKAAEVIGKPLFNIIESIVPSEDSIELLKKDMKSKSWKGELIQRTKNNTYLNVVSSSCLLRDISGKPIGIVMINHDITKQIQAQEQITMSLKEKEALLKEIHHRVKNNLQIISSLLNLQSRYVEDPRYHQFFIESQNRIKTMVIVHEKLYQTDDLTNIYTSSYITTLTQFLFDSYNITPGNIALKLNIENFKMNIDMAIPCGLIINELISNSLKYAFEASPKTRKNEVEISLRKSQSDHITLIVRDNGKGFPDNIDFRNTHTLGLQLVIALVEQLSGNILLNTDKGTMYTIEFILHK